jgi:hypothetical protein
MQFESGTINPVARKVHCCHIVQLMNKFPVLKVLFTWDNVLQWIMYTISCVYRLSKGAS